MTSIITHLATHNVAMRSTFTATPITSSTSLVILHWERIIRSSIRHEPSIIISTLTKRISHELCCSLCCSYTSSNLPLCYKTISLLRPTTPLTTHTSTTECERKPSNHIGLIHWPMISIPTYSWFLSVYPY